MSNKTLYIYVDAIRSFLVPQMVVSKLGSLLNHSLTVNQAKQIQALILVNGLYHLEPLIIRQVLISTPHFSQITTQYVRLILHHMQNPDVFSWSCTIRFLSQHNQFREAFSLYVQMQRLVLCPSSFAISSSLKACARIGYEMGGISIHAQVHKFGFCGVVYVQTALVDFYSKLGSTGIARKVFDEMVGKNVVSWNSMLSGYLRSGDLAMAHSLFDEMPKKDVVSWTSMISGYMRVGKPRNSIGMFSEMLDFGVEPNGFTLSAVIKACSELGDLKVGRRFHGVVFRRGFDSNHVIASALIDMYGKNYESKDARQLFDELLEPDAICWTSVISALTRNDLFKKALGFFYLMQRKYGLSPDGFTFGTVLTACGNLGRLKQGKEVHAKVITTGICGNVVVESSLVDMYGKCGLVDESRRVFDRMTQKNLVSWCALLGGYCQKGDFETVIDLFREMNEVDLYSFGTILRACAGLAAVRQGKEVHCQYLRKGGWRDVIVESALVDLYAKSGCIDFAYRIFVQMAVRNLITWNSMICGFAQNGRGGEALRMFDEMVMEGIKPDYISFIGILFACSHTGLLDQGREHFTSMTEQYGIKAGIEHYNCMVDLLGRDGQIEDAENLILNTEFKDDSSLWAALLGACSTSTNSVVAERIAKKMMELEPEYHLSYVLLANVYRAIGRWSDALKIWRLMQDRGVKKKPGKSWIETKSRLGSSTVGMTYLDMPNETEFPDMTDLVPLNAEK